jgi:hypothetical protein
MFAELLGASSRVDQKRSTIIKEQNKVSETSLVLCRERHQDVKHGPVIVYSS